jgi:hypothetical protein
MIDIVASILYVGSMANVRTTTFPKMLFAIDAMSIQRGYGPMTKSSFMKDDSGPKPVQFRDTMTLLLRKGLIVEEKTLIVDYFDTRYRTHVDRVDLSKVTDFLGDRSVFLNEIVPKLAKASSRIGSGITEFKAWKTTNFYNAMPMELCTHDQAVEAFSHELFTQVS